MTARSPFSQFYPRDTLNQIISYEKITKSNLSAELPRELQYPAALLIRQMNQASRKLTLSLFSSRFGHLSFEDIEDEGIKSFY